MKVQWIQGAPGCPGLLGCHWCPCVPLGLIGMTGCHWRDWLSLGVAMDPRLCNGSKVSMCPVCSIEFLCPKVFEHAPNAFLQGNLAWSNSAMFVLLDSCVVCRRLQHPRSHSYLSFSPDFSPLSSPMGQVGLVWGHI